jgi:hypothetical protein
LITCCICLIFLLVEASAHFAKQNAQVESMQISSCCLRVAPESIRKESSSTCYHGLTFFWQSIFAFAKLTQQETGRVVSNKGTFCNTAFVRATLVQRALLHEILRTAGSP